MNFNLPATQPHQILRLPAVMARTGMGRSWIYQAASSNRFPKPRKIGRASGWDAAEVDRWVAETLNPGDATIAREDAGQ